MSDAVLPVRDGGRLRVLEVSYSQRVWGAELATMALVGPLAARGIDLTMAAPSGGDLEEHWRRLGVPFVPLEFPARHGIRGEGHGGRPGPVRFAGELATSVRSARMIAAVAKDFDLVHSNSLWAHLDCALAGRLARRPVVLELYDLVRPGLGRHLLSAAAGLSTVAIAISRAVADIIGPLGARHVTIVPLAVDLERFGPGPAPAAVRRRLTSDEHAPLVGIVGRIDPEKGVDVLVRAMAALSGPAAAAHLVVVGSPGVGPEGYAEQVHDEAERLLGDRVRFVGRTEDVPATLRALDVLVNASVAEPFGLSVLEAQASAVAVVGTRAGGIPDFVADGDTGLLVAPRQVEALAGALDRLITDPALRAGLAERGRRSAQRRGIEGRAEVIAELYRQVARRAARPPVLGRVA